MRRIDALFCSRDGVEERARALIADIDASRHAAANEVARAISDRIAALEARQQTLLGQIDQVATLKVQSLSDQVRHIQASKRVEQLPPDLAEEAGSPDAVFLCADATITFKIGSEDFLEKIPNFGNITEASTYASRSVCRGPALGTLKVGNPSFLSLLASDKDGQRRVEGGDEVEVVFSDPEAFSDLNVEDCKDGKYKISFLPCQPGNFDLQISIHPPGLPAEDVAGSPFKIVVASSTEVTRIGLEGEPQKPRIAESNSQSGILGTVFHPSGVDFDHSGRYLFVVDQGNHRILVFDLKDPEGSRPVYSYGRKGTGPEDLDTPCDIVVDEENHVIVSDLLNHRLQVLDFVPRTASLRHRTSIESAFEFPKGLGLTDRHQILVCDSGNHRVQVLDTVDNFRLVRTIGCQGSVDGQFTNPLDATVNRAGEIFVSDSTNRIQVFDAEGNFLRAFGAKGKKDGFFNHPASLAVSDEDVLFVCDQGNRRIQAFRASDGTFLHKWGAKKTKKGAEAEANEDDEAPAEPVIVEPELGKPMGIAVNAHGHIVVSDYENNMIWSY